MALLLVGFDGSPSARRALDHAAARAKANGDEILLVTVVPAAARESGLHRMLPAGLEMPPPLARTFEEGAASRLGEVVEELTKAGVKAHAEVVGGDAGAAVLALAASKGADEIIIGHKAYEGPHLRLGHNAEAILRGATVPVTVVP